MEAHPEATGHLRRLQEVTKAVRYQAAAARAVQVHTHPEAQGVLWARAVAVLAAAAADHLPEVRAAVRAAVLVHHHPDVGSMPFSSLNQLNKMP